MNLRLIDVLFDPLAGLADDDEAMLYRSLDPDDEAAVRAVMRELLVPYLSTWAEPARAMAKLGLAYGLSFQRDVLADRFYSMLPPFGLPDPPDRFFEVAVGRAVRPGELAAVRSRSLPRRLGLGGDPRQAGLGGGQAGREAAVAA